MAVVCPYCGSHLTYPIWGEVEDQVQIRHHWICKECGKDFDVVYVSEGFSTSDGTPIEVR